MSKPRRLWIAIALLALVALSVTVTWIASGRIRSPAEVAARTLAPEPSAILVPVESRTISTDVVTRGTGRFGSPQTLATVPSNLKAVGYIDSAPLVGAEVSEGDVALVVSGRPVLILEGTQPGFRDLGPGLSGTDVLQFEEALERLGFHPGDIDGTYDSGTELAVVAWYAANGYQAITATADQLAAIRAIEGELDSIERDSLAATETVALADAEVLVAQDAHRVAQAAEAQTQAALTAARAEAEAANAVAKGEVEIAERAIGIAWQTLPPFHAPQDEQDLAYAELESLRVVAETAEASADLVRASGEAAVTEAELAAAEAPAEVAAAAAALEAARTRASLARQAVTLAESSIPLLENDLTVAEARAGVQVPADEVIFVADTPVRVSEVHVRRGDEANGPLLSVTDAIVAIDGTLALDQVALVTSGMQVEISEADLGIEASGVVSIVADSPGTRGADGFHVWFETLVTGTTATNVVGASVRLTIPVESTGGPVLAVPASALTLAADGSSQVLVDRDGELVAILVEPGLSASGYVGVEPLSDTLLVGDLVVIGFEQRAASGG